MAGLLVVYSQDVSATESAEEIAWEIHSALKKHDPDTAALVESAIKRQESVLNDPIGAASAELFTLYGPLAPDEAALNWLKRAISNLKRVRQSEPQICYPYASGDPVALAISNEKLFSSEDRIADIKVLRDIVLGAIESPIPITDPVKTEDLFEKLVLEAEEWAYANNDFDCGLVIHMYESMLDHPQPEAADLVRLQFTPE